MSISPHALIGRLRAGIGLVYREMIKFGVVGAIAFVIDLGLANLLWHTVLEDKVTTAKIISGAAATLFAWFGNRVWTFRHRRSRAPLQEVVLFFGVNAVALGISAGVLALSHYGLGFQTRLADNIAVIVGIGIGTIFRFVAYRYLVFSGVVPSEPGAGGPEDGVDGVDGPDGADGAPARGPAPDPTPVAVVGRAGTESQGEWSGASPRNNANTAG